MGSPEHIETRGDTIDSIQGMGDTGCLQGELSHMDNYSQGMGTELIEQHPAGWWSYNNYCRQVTVLQDRIQGTEEQLGLKEAMLRDYRERCKLLEESLTML